MSNVASNIKNHKETRHPFAGCNNLLAQYRSVGAGLLTYEKESGFNTFLDLYTDLRNKETPAERNLRHSLSFISVEVMESYLDDLLDLEVSEEKLFIQAGRKFPFGLLISSLGILLAIVAGLFMVDSGQGVTLSFAITVLFAIPFVVLWHLSPKSGVARRLVFARVLSHEISRRRGNDGERIVESKAVFSKLISQKIVHTSRSKICEVVLPN